MRAGLVERGQSWSNADETEERKDEVAASGERAGKDSRDGREETIAEERVEWLRVLRLRLVVTPGRLVGLGGRVEREREKVMRWWSDRIRGVTERLRGEHALVNTRSRTLPTLWVGGEGVSERSSEDRRDVTGRYLSAVGRLKSPSRIRGVPSSGKELIRASSSSRKSPRDPGGR